jgi:predicted nucleic acid-binding protein
LTTYIDTALFVKAFVREGDSAEAVAILNAVGEPFAFSHLHEIEIPNAIRLKRFRGEITRAQETAALRAFRREVDEGRFAHLDYDLATVFKHAEQLSARFSAEHGTRSLDLWHVAAALEAGCTAFASYDARQRQAAAACKLILLPPARPSRA